MRPALIVVGLGVLAACGGAGTSAPPASTSAVPRSEATVGRIESGVRPTPGGLRMSGASAEGPCSTSDGEQVERYRYERRTSCVIPVFVVETGVFGCPVELTLESRPDEAMTYEYDASGHMVRADRERFAWDGDVLRSSNRGSGDIPIGIEGRRVWMGDAQSPEREAILDERGRPTRIRRFANGSLFSEATQTYDGERLAGVRIRFSPNGGGSDVVATPCD